MRQIQVPILAPMSANLFRGFLIIVWLGLILMLFREPQEERPDFVLLPASDSGSPNEGWMGLYMNGRKVGYSNFEMKRVDSGFELIDRSVLRLRMLDRDQKIFAQTTAATDATHALRSFKVRLQSDIGRFQLKGEVRSGEVLIDLNVGGKNDRRRFPLDQPIFLPSALRASMVAAGLEAGASRKAAIFDAASLTTEPVVVRTTGVEELAVAGGVVDAWRIVESFRGMETTVWLGRDGRVLREEGPLGLVAVREDRQTATEEGWSEGALVDLMDAVAVPVRAAIGDARERRELRLRIGGIDKIKLPEDQRQSLRAGVLTVRREIETAQGTFALPSQDRRWREDLLATAFVQSDHPRIHEVAKRALSGSTDALEAALRLRRWVYDNLEKRAVASIPNALQVLEMGAGDCNEHAVLFAALARAVGLPTRIVAGLVYSEGVFLYHAWNEVWLGTGWVSVDTALDQMPADATHIKVIEGEPDRHVELIPLIGKLSLALVGERTS